MPTTTKSLSSLPSTTAKTYTPSPAARRPTLKRSIDETAFMATPSSPSKRSRVTFDSDVEIVSADDEEELDPLVVKEQVRRALERHRLHEDEAYERIRALFAAPYTSDHSPSTKVLKLHLSALLTNVTSLSKDCSTLVTAVLHSEWVGRDESYYALYVKFLNNLAAAQRGYQQKIMTVLVDLLGPQKTRRIGGAKPVRQPRIHRRTLLAIQHITSNVPSAPAALADRIAARLDFEFAKPDDRMTFIKSFMHLIKYVPELSSEILTNVLKELIKLDVAVQVDLDDDDEEDDAEDDILNYMSSSQTLPAATSMQNDLASDSNDDLSTTDESDMEQDDETDSPTLRRQKLKSDIRQIDIIMDILFTHYTSLTTSSHLPTRDAAIDQLINHFHTFILPTYRARHPQFLAFHFAQSDPIIVDRFVTSCIAILVDRKQPYQLRHAAAAYFSGFVGRGAHVSPQVVSDCLDLLSSHLTSLLKQYTAPTVTPKSVVPDLKRYGDFYATFQAMLYIFCFRWRDIASPSSDLEFDSESEDEYGDYSGTGKRRDSTNYHFSESLCESLRAAIYSPLNPLRICTPVIVEQFANLSYALQLFYLFPKLEENRHVRVATSWRSAASASSSVSSASASANNIAAPDRDTSWVGDNGMLEGYFPYDPYHLPRSKHWVDADYVVWPGIPGEEAQDSDSADDDMDIGADDDGEGEDEDDMADDDDA